MKILILGFQRSGTTLLKDLIWKHPDIKHMFHEVALMRHPKNVLMKAKTLPDKRIRNNYQGVVKYQHKVDFNMSKANWGEKIPYWTPKIFKGFRGTVVKYCNTWLDYFGDEARILNIIRHPLDVAISTKKRGFTREVGLPLRTYKRTLPIVLNGIERHVVKKQYIKHVQFEELVVNPFEQLVEIYKFCNLRRGKKIISRVVNNKNIFRFRKINSDRAYSYPSEGYKVKNFKLGSIIKKLNTVNGIHYNENKKEKK